MSYKAAELYEAFRNGRGPLILDVRNEADFSSWRVEAPGRVETLNVPYYEFIEGKDASAARVAQWMKHHGDKVAVVCAHGGSSDFVADLLRRRGLPAENLEGGMNGWGDATISRLVTAAAPARAWQIQRIGKGCLSYVVAGGRDAIVVDPHRHVDEYSRLLRSEGLTLRGVFDTHLHADHISGGAPLAEAFHVPYFANPLDFHEASIPAYEAIQDRSRLRLGELEVFSVMFLYAPGHTPGSTLLMAGDSLLLTGDTLFVEGIGRPDLGGKAAEWGRDLYETLRKRMAGLHDDRWVLPAHAAGPREQNPDGTFSARLGSLRRSDPTLEEDEESFLRRIERGTRPAPDDYARIRLINLGQAEASEEERVRMELGKNECALARR
ncbi:MAG: MBL fold metallo-hydrolase [Planctomycetes bacterium]|nr:MBL fold metallo-hydrolase [Planctomycetota bacterium]